MTMFAAQPTIESPQIWIRLKPVIEMTEDQFFEFCQINRDLRIERTAKGDLIIMPPAGGETSRRNADITAELRN
jgi:Uma2 family endonuclease